MRPACVFVMTWTALSNAISIFNVTNSSCENDAALCMNDTTCNPIIQRYLNNCSAVLNEINGTFPYQEGQCPDECQGSLDAYLQYLYPNEISTAYCQCGDSSCDGPKQQLYQQRCIASDCAYLNQQCLNNTVCANLYKTFNDTCFPVYTPLDNPQWTYNFCPTGCAEALHAYVEHIAPNYTSLRFCDCNGEEACIKTKDALVRSGCATPVCQDQWEDCLEDTSCNATARVYYDACESIINVNFSGSYCPSDCRKTLRDYIDVVAPDSTTLNFCTCAEDQNCVSAKDNLVQFGCVASDCEQYWIDCNNDDDCRPIAETYLEKCGMIINGSWSEDWCPSSCSYALSMYIKEALTNFSYSNPLDYCDCNANPGCVEGRHNLINAGCFAEDCVKLHVEKCVPNPQCMSVHADYLNACMGVFNESQEFCPPDCAYQLTQYLPFITDKSDIDDLSSVCSCSSGSDCDTFTTNLMEAGCLKQDCGQIWYNCQQNSNCANISQLYLNDCSAVINNPTDVSLTECPANCMDSLSAYIGASSMLKGVISKEYCDCNGDSNCQTIQDKLVAIGCIADHCEYQYSICLLDATCEPIAQTYLDSCQSVINGSITANNGTRCPFECANALQAYIQKVYGTFEEEITNYCQCSGDDNGCETVQGILQDLKCGDPDDCTFRDQQCAADDPSGCSALRTEYFDKCQEFINGSYVAGGYTVCPLDCSEALRAYIMKVYGSTDESIEEYCNCNGQTECSTIQGFYKDLSCLDELTASPTKAPVISNPPGAGKGVNLLTHFAVLLVMISVAIM